MVLSNAVLYKEPGCWIIEANLQHDLLLLLVTAIFMSAFVIDGEVERRILKWSFFYKMVYLEWMDEVYKYVISPPSALRASASLASPLLRL